MRQSGADIPNLAGQLLVAHPSLREPNFRRTILFISAHDENEGAHGLVINRPANKRLGDILPGQGLEALGSVPVYLGGPVGTHELTIASFDWVTSETKLAFSSHLSLDQARDMAAEQVATLRAFIGYAGWTGGQLESELKQSAWIVHPATETILNEQSDQVWLSLMKRLGPAYHLLGLAPDDPSLN